jgi:chromosome segregation ATPase
VIASLESQLLSKTKVESTLHEQQEDRDVQIKSLNDKIQALQRKNDVLNGDLRLLKSSKKDIEIENSRMQDEFRRLEDELERTTKDSEDREQRYLKYELELADKLEGYNDARRELDKLKKTLEAKDKELVELKAWHYTHTMGAEALKGGGLEMELEEMRKKFRDLEDERTKLEITCERLKKENQNLKFASEGNPQPNEDSNYYENL